MKQAAFRGQLHRLELNHGKSYTEEQSQFLWAELQHLSDETFATTVQRLLDSREDRGLPAKADFVRASEGKAAKQSPVMPDGRPAATRTVTRCDLEVGEVWRQFVARWLDGQIATGPDHAERRPRNGAPGCRPGTCAWCDQYREVTQIVARLDQDPALRSVAAAGLAEATATANRTLLDVLAASVTVEAERMTNQLLIGVIAGRDATGIT